MAVDAGSLATGLDSPGWDCLEGIGWLLSIDPTWQRIRCPGRLRGLSHPKEEEEKEEEEEAKMSISNILDLSS